MSAATVVIAAAGSGRRLGADGPKAFVELAGRPLLAHALAGAAAAGSVQAAVVAVPAADLERARELVGTLELGIAVEVCEGGATRAQSVRAALDAVEAEIVVIHDAARPLARSATFDRLTALLASDPDLAGAIAATPVADTLKRRRGEGHGVGRGGAVAPRVAARDEAGAEGHLEIASTLSREGLWVAQTPQAFRLDTLRSAQALAIEQDLLETATDEASLVEAAGGRVAMVPVSYPNFKVTVPEDLRTATALLERPGGV